MGLDHLNGFFGTLQKPINNLIIIFQAIGGPSGREAILIGMRSGLVCIKSSTTHSNKYKFKFFML